MNGGWDEQFLAPLWLIPLILLIPGIPGIPRMNSKSQEKRINYDTKRTLVIQDFPIGHEDMFGWVFFSFWDPNT